jgi:gamma-glutamylcysteine synthetase
VASGQTQADRLLDLYRTAWGGDLTHVYTHCAY